MRRGSPRTSRTEIHVHTSQIRIAKSFEQRDIGGDNEAGKENQHQDHAKGNARERRLFLAPPISGMDSKGGKIDQDYLDLCDCGDHIVIVFNVRFLVAIHNA